MIIAFEELLTKLSMSKLSDDEAREAEEVIVSEIVALSAAGEHDPQMLCAGVLGSLRRYGEAIPRRPLAHSFPQ